MRLDLTHCTLTGIDKATPVKALRALSKAYPFAEWGMLYSPARAGMEGDNRYMDRASIIRTISGLHGHARFAVHLCGRAIPDLLEGEPFVSMLVHRTLAHHDRIQFNLNATLIPELGERLVAWLHKRPEVCSIVQYNPANAAIPGRTTGLPNIAFLADASGGRGIECETWPAPLTMRWGYAGGLGPDNLAAQLPRISAAARGQSFWIDMETKLRNAQDHFDIDAAEYCLHAAQQFLDV